MKKDNINEIYGALGTLTAVLNTINYYLAHFPEDTNKLKYLTSEGISAINQVLDRDTTIKELNEAIDEELS